MIDTITKAAADFDRIARHLKSLEIEAARLARCNLLNPAGIVKWLRGVADAIEGDGKEGTRLIDGKRVG